MLNVAMGHTHAMQVCAAVKHLFEDAQHLFIAGNKTLLSLIEQLGKRDRGEILHLYRVPLALRRYVTHPVDVDDAWMRCLSHERRTFGQFLISLSLCLRNLHRDDRAIRKTLSLSMSTESTPPRSAAL